MTNNNNYPNQFQGQYGPFTSGFQQSMLNMQAQGAYLQSGFPYQSNPQFQTNSMMGINSNPMMGAVGPMAGIRSSQPLQPTAYPNAVSPPGSGSQGGGQKFASTSFQVPAPTNIPMGMPYQQQQPVNHLYPSIRKNSANSIPFQGAAAANGSPINKPQYHIPSNQKEKYANIYALLYTIDELQSCFCSGRVSSDEYSKKIENFLKQFETARNPLNLSNDDIERFTQAFDMNVSYALDVIKNPTALMQPTQSDSGSMPPPTDNSSISDYFALGGNFTTLSDCCVLEGLEANEFQSLLTTMRGRFQNIGVYQRNQKVKEYTDKWIDIFSKMKPTDIVSKEIKDQLQADIFPWRDAFSSA